MSDEKEKVVWVCRECDSDQISGWRGNITWSIDEQRWITDGPEERVNCDGCEREVWAVEKPLSAAIQARLRIDRTSPDETLRIITGVYRDREHHNPEHLYDWAHEYIEAVQVGSWRTVEGLEFCPRDTFRLLIAQNISIQGWIHPDEGTPVDVMIHRDRSPLTANYGQEKALHWFVTLFQDSLKRRFKPWVVERP